MWRVVDSQRLPHPVAHRVEPLADEARELRLAARQHLAHGQDAAGGLGLDAGDLAHALLDLVGALGLQRRALVAGAGRAARRVTASAISATSRTSASASNAAPTLMSVPAMTNRVSFIALGSHADTDGRI